MSYPAQARAPEMDLESFPPAEQPVNEQGAAPPTAGSLYGTFKKGLEKDGGQPRQWLDGAVKLLAAVAVFGVLLSHLSPLFLPTNSGYVSSHHRAPSLPEKSSVGIEPARGHVDSQQPSVLDGHCMDREPSTCASWFQPNGAKNSTSMCAADLHRARPICPRSCGSCSLLLVGCKNLKVVDMGQNCKQGEDVVGEVCENDDKPGESYCTYLPSVADGPKAKFVCALCNDPITMISPERQVLLAQMKELRNEEISREDERLMAQQHRQITKNHLGDLLPKFR